MSVQRLFERIASDGLGFERGARTFEFDGELLERLRPEYDPDEVWISICPYFPSGRLALEEVDEVEPPDEGGWIHLWGTGKQGPFDGFRVHLRLAVGPKGAARPALRLIVEAFGRSPGSHFTLAHCFPAYAGTLLSELRFFIPDAPALATFRLASTSIPELNVVPGMIFVGILEVDSLSGVGEALFLGPRRPEEDLLAVVGVVAAFPPADSEALPQQVAAHIAFHAALASTPNKLGNLLALESVRLSVSAKPYFNSVRMRWEHESHLTWQAKLVSRLSAKEIRIPIAVRVQPHAGRFMVRSNLTQGISMTMAELSGLIPGSSLDLPATDFEVVGPVEVSEVEMMLDTGPGAELIEYLQVEVQTALDRNRWVLIDRVLTLDAIDLRFLIGRPASRARSLQVSLTGLVGIGDSGRLKLSTSFAADGHSADYELRGELLHDPEAPGPGTHGANLNVTEVLTQFLGRSQHPSLPRLWVRDFSFSIAPRRKTYSGYIQVFGEWPMPGASTFILEDLAFGLRRSGESSTAFQAQGAFRLGQIAFFVAADYHSGGDGWTFEGGTLDDGSIPLGTLIGDAMALLSGPASSPPQLPAAIAGLSLCDLSVRFNTGTSDFAFHGAAEFPVDGDPNSGSKATLAVQVDLRHAENGQREVTFGGRLNVGGRELGVLFDSGGTTELMVASYAKSGGEKIDLHDLLASLSTRAANSLPTGIEIALDHVQVAIAHAPQGAPRFLFGVELGAGVQLSKLPLVGRVFERSQTLAVTIQIVVASDSFSEGEVRRINALSAQGVTPFADDAIDASKTPVHVRASLSLGGKSFPASLPLEWPDPNQGLEIAAPAVTGAESDALVQWFPLQRAYGSFHFERAGVGLSADRSKLELIFDASLELGALTLSLAGLGAELELAALSTGSIVPTFHLDGIGLDFKSGDLELGGALLRRGSGAYDGGLVVHYRSFGIVAVGSLAEVAGQPSVFAYAVVDYSIGGPAFFFVQGLTFGFGYNRSLAIPDLEQVPSFPLVALAQRPVHGMQVGELARQISAHLRLAEGEYFVAAGVRFTSFKIIEGTLLLAVVFGKRFEVDVLGVATLSSPPRAQGQPLLMHAELAVRARYRPEDGVVSVRGALTPGAFLFSPECHLTGGFALCAWQNTGDFVATMGGYHSAFHKPPHYPTVPRLGLSWQVSPNLSLKADAYFAMTPAAFMAGGHLRANWVSGNLHAWFNAGIDCLVDWQPFHYDAEAEISIGATYRTWCHTFSVELGARLKVWGPPFSGTAHVSWHIFSFDVNFGRPRAPVQMLDWAALRQAFLPAELLTASVGGGRAAPHGAVAGESADRNTRDQLGIVNAREFSITIRSAIPITTGTVLGTKLPLRSWALGVPAMGARKLESDLSIQVRHAGRAIEQELSFELEEQSVPTALWGQTRPAGPNAPALTKAITGVTIRPKPITPQDVREARPQRPDFTIHPLKVPSPNHALLAADAPNAAARVRGGVQRDAVRRARTSVLAGLLPNADSDWSGRTVSELRSAPRLVRSGAQS